ncbi:Hpt domain-containing protein [Psychrobacter sp. 72-O-c]|uniref:Hpt domain-containing protein n=1 Tax=Psychrobacter sp. 72-O-c TaxID=2774125 RepID=UPI001918C7DA|nr:Hpt domain-containing protein [Psychrobacter sp. 72-O-c]
MKNQPNEMVTLERLLPLLNQQLSQVADGWQVGSSSPDYEHMAPHYHQVSGALIMINLPLLASLATKLSLLAGVGNSEKLSTNISTDISADHCRTAQFSHQLLQHELAQYVRTGTYYVALVKKAVDELTQTLSQLGIVTESTKDSTSIARDNTVYDINKALPNSITIGALTSQQYQQLLIVWRQQVQQLLVANANQPPVLTVLEKVSQYLWQTSSINVQQRLWYLAERWLNELASNEKPLPKHYAPLLAQLDQVIEACAHHTQVEDGQSPTETNADTDGYLAALSPDIIKNLVTDIYVELNALAQSNEHTQSRSDRLSQSTDNDDSNDSADTVLRFLPRILSELETVILALDKPHSLLKLLQQIKTQLERRGWTLFASQIKLIMTDVEQSISSETEFARIQVEQQLQELYNAIYNTEQAIHIKIGDTASLFSKPTTPDIENLQTDAITDVIPSDKRLRELRIAVEEVKQHFNEYIQRQQTHLLPDAKDFIRISSAFKDMGLPSVGQATDSIGTVFAQLVAHDISTLNWELTQALAESLTAIELLLDCLAQQIFDQQLLAQANRHIEQATELLIARLQTSDTANDNDTYLSKKVAATDVIRYDDSGEIAPSINQPPVDQTLINETTISSTSDGDTTLKPNAHDVIDETDSEALLSARAQVKPDNFDMDEEIRDIFIEEATEVIADLGDFLPIWEQDAQDLTPLTEVRRGFHTLKGSGRMVGAFSISEMAWSIEDLLNHLLNKTMPVSEDVVALVIQTTKRLSLLVTDFESLQAPSVDPAITILQSNNLRTNQPLNAGLATSVFIQTEADIEKSISENENENDLSLEEQRATPDHLDLVDSIDDAYRSINNSSDVNDDTSENASNDGVSNEQGLPVSISGLEIPVVLVPFMQETSQLPTDANDADPDIKEIFIEEAYEVLAEIVPLYEQWQQTAADLSNLADIRRGFHTLKGSGRMVGANYTAGLAWSIENMLNRILDHSITVSADIRQLIADVLTAYPALVATFESDGHDYPAVVPLWIACADAYSKQYGDEFSYSALRDKLLNTPEQQPIDHLAISSDGDMNAHSINRGNSSALGSSASDNSDPDSTDVNNNDHVDSMLQTIYSVNEIMAEAPVVLTPQSEEEQAFCEIFIEEAEELLQDINDFVGAHQDQSHIEVSDEIVRAFHTLRAASGSKALAAISDVSATIEQSLEQLQQQDTLMSAQHLQALTQSVELIDGYLSNYKQNLQQQNLSGEDNQSQQDLASLQAMLGESDDTVNAADSQLSISQLLDENIDELLDAEWQLNAALSYSDLEHVQTYIQQQILQIKYLAAKVVESPKFTSILGALGGAYAYLNKHPQQARDADIQTIMLAGHAQLVGLFDALAGSMSLKVNEQVIESLQSLSHNNDSYDDNSSHDVATDSASDTVQSTSAPKLQLESIDTDAELLEIFLEEAQELDTAIAESFSKWRADITNTKTLKILQRHLHTIKGGARMAGIRSIGDMTHEAESIYEAFVEDRRVPTAQWLAIMQIVQDTLSLQITHILNHQTSFFAHELIEQLRQFEQTDTLPATVTLILPAPHKRVGTEPQSVADESDRGIDKAPDSLSLDRLIKESWSNGLPDPDILEVFLEEAQELTNRNKYLQQFLNNVSDTVALQSLQRDLHTIKGGARMVAANGIADLAHEMETVYEDLASRRRPATKKILELLVTCHDWLADAVFILEQQVNPPTPTLLIEALEQFVKNPDSLKQIPNESLQAQRTTILTAKAKQESEYIEEDISEMPPLTGNFTEQEQSASSNEMIRISGGLIEHMINLSGESAINRARIDMGMSSLTNSIEDMGTTVQRLADQLRRMEIELEAQILSQIDDELISHEGFDPLEMDQYSSLNQLSKSLTESASDLIDINSTLLEKTRDSESLLLQLSRTQTELQDGLMNSRMVPFTHLTPRLERVVRQTANELNKSVELTIINADDEMDRTILERITSPLEHMLRNAVDHGIENTATRLKAGKDRSGRITLEVLREGSEIVINLSDDGRGIDVEAVRDKAISQGLIDAEDTSLTDIDIMQYIFNAGLSTTKQVTQISGRGVGMDVVISEIRQLGGLVSVMSKPEQGSRFTIRVPLTVAVSDALVVRAADRYYAIPLVQIERVVRINPEKLYDYYQSGEGTLRLEGANYRVRYLNEILSGNKLNELMVNTNTSLPLILIKNRTGQNIALQVDQIAGSRIEVVVKPLGRQLAHLAGISAATIMGDGSVMLILDLITLMRNTPALKDIPQSTKPERSRSKSQPTILVVDDSVTVRKVTSRFLERQGINVALAKDGIDAIEILQETTPDLILLDIEMPRMDGFEVAIQVRHNKRLQHIPIIMITSRTGEKHRERALEIGVNDYMGKPFQEKELLNKIQRLLGKQVSLTYEG